MKLISVLSSQEYPFNRLQETADNGEPLEVILPDISRAKIRSGRHLYQRFKEFLPIPLTEDFSLKEGNTPLEIAQLLKNYAGLKTYFLKNETLNPTGSFKDRGFLYWLQPCAKR